MPPRRNHHVFLALPRYLDFTRHRNAFKVVRHFLGQACYESMLSDELRKRYEQEPLPVQVDDIDFTLEQLNTVMSTVARRTKGKGLEPAEVWDQLRREAESLSQHPYPPQQQHDEASLSSTRIRLAEDVLNDYVSVGSSSSWPPIPSLPRCSSTNPDSRPIESFSFPLLNCEGQSPRYTQDLDIRWPPAAAPHHSVSLSPFSNLFPETPRHDFRIPSPALSPTENFFTSESNGGSSSHLPCPTSFHERVVPPNTSNPIPDHHHDLNFNHKSHSSSPYFSTGSEHPRPPIEETSSAERKEVSLCSPTEARAVKRARPCSPLPRPQPPPSTIYVPYSRYCRALVKGHHEVITAETNVYFDSNDSTMANFYSDPRAIYRTNRDDLDQCLYRIGERTSTKPLLQCGTLSIIASGRPVDVERAMDGVRYLMEEVLPMLKDCDSGPMFVGFVEQYICNREPYFSRFANLRFRDQEVSSRKTVSPVIRMPLEVEGLPPNTEEASRQDFFIPERRPLSSESLRRFTAQNSFLESGPPSSQLLHDPTAQVRELEHVGRMAMMGQFSVEDFRREAVFSPGLEQRYSPTMVHSWTSDRRWVPISPTVLPSTELDEAWSSFGGTTHAPTQTHHARIRPLPRNSTAVRSTAIICT